jgi:FMN phosphatase YigB (HAD superfamily)
MEGRPQINRARAVVFDVDGTLYDARRLRRRMLAELFVYCLADPRRLTLLRKLQLYRRERERLAEEEAADIATLQYERPAALLGVPYQAIEQTITPWIYRRPLRHLEAVRISGIRRFFDYLRESGRQLGVLSDYPAEGKLEALGLEAHFVVAGTDPEVNRLKPHPAGLEVLTRALGVDPSDCLLIGDRDDRDAEVARRLEMPYLLRVARASDSTVGFTDYTELLPHA